MALDYPSVTLDAGEGRIRVSTTIISETFGALERLEVAAQANGNKLH